MLSRRELNQSEAPAGRRRGFFSEVFFFFLGLTGRLILRLRVGGERKERGESEPGGGQGRDFPYSILLGLVGGGMYVFNRSTADTKVIRKLQLGVLSSENVRALSVVHVTQSGSFNGGKRVQDGLADLRMGASDRHTTCATCRNTYSGDPVKQNDCAFASHARPSLYPTFNVGGTKKWQAAAPQPPPPPAPLPPHTVYFSCPSLHSPSV